MRVPKHPSHASNPLHKGIPEDYVRDEGLYMLVLRFFYKAFQHLLHGFQKSVGRLSCKNSVAMPTVRQIREGQCPLL